MKQMNNFLLILLALAIFSSCSKENNMVNIDFASLDTAYEEAVEKITTNSNFKVTHNDIELVFNNIKAFEGVEIENSNFIGNETEETKAYLIIDNTEKSIYIQYSNSEYEYELIGSSNEEVIKGAATNKTYNADEINNANVNWLAQSTNNSILVRKNLNSLEKDLITLNGENAHSCGNHEEDEEIVEYNQTETEELSHKSETRRTWDIVIVRHWSERSSVLVSSSILRTWISWRFLSVGSYNYLNGARPYMNMRFSYRYVCQGMPNCLFSGSTNSLTYLNDFRDYVINNYTDRSDVIYIYARNSSWASSVAGRAYYGKSNGVRAAIANVTASNTTFAHEIIHTLDVTHYNSGYREVHRGYNYQKSLMFHSNIVPRFYRIMDWRKRNIARGSLIFDN